MPEIYIVFSSEENGHNVVEAVTDSMSLAGRIVKKCSERDKNKNYFYDELSIISETDEADELIESICPDE